MSEHLYETIEFPLFLTRYLDFSYTDCYDIPFSNIEPKKTRKKGEFGTPEWFLENDKFVLTKDRINPKHLNLWYMYNKKWVNISKMTTEYTLDHKFIKSFNKNIKELPIYDNN